MTIDLGADILTSSFTGSAGSFLIRGPSVWLGEIAADGSIPPGDEEIPDKNYAF